MKSSEPIPRRIVLTGGPGAGKTVIAQQIAARFADQLVLVPEAATQVYSELQTRWDRLDDPGRRRVQRQIYHFQQNQEHRIHQSHPDKILLLDRGSIDGAAYWPHGPADYWRDLNTSLEAELSKYDAVIWLQTAATLGIYDGDASNTCRYEDSMAAIESGHALLPLWAGHPRLKKVDAYPKLEDKIRVVETLLLDFGITSGASPEQSGY